MSPTRSRAFGYDRDVVRVRIRLVFILGLIAAAAAASCGGFEASDATAVDAGADASVAADVAVAAPPDASVDATVDPPGDPCAKCRSKHCDDKGACDPFVFITVALFKGDLGPTDAGGVGLARADAICQLAAGDGGVFHAWLSDETHDALTRVAGTGTPTSRPLRRHDGEVVANKLSDLVVEDGGALAAITLGPNGELIPTDRVWTATDQYGRRRGPNCFNWQTSEGQFYGVHGRSIPGREWSIIRDGVPDINCDQVARLYCFEELH